MTLLRANARTQYSFNELKMYTNKTNYFSLFGLTKHGGTKADGSTKLATDTSFYI